MQVTSIQGTAPLERRLMAATVVGNWTYIVGGEYRYGVYSDVYGTRVCFQ